MANWQLNEGAIVERTRAVDDHPLLVADYDHRDRLLAGRALERGGRTLEVAFGTLPHPDGYGGTASHPPNAREADDLAVATTGVWPLPIAPETVDAVDARPLGAPLVPSGSRRSPITARPGSPVDGTQWVRWWTTAVGESRGRSRKTVRGRPRTGGQL